MVLGLDSPRSADSEELKAHASWKEAGIRQDEIVAEIGEVVCR